MDTNEIAIKEKNVAAKKKKLTDDVEFQILEWRDSYETFENEDDDDSDDNTLTKHVILLFGRTRDDKTVFAKITDYKPFFYIEIPAKWRQNQIELFMTDVTKKVYPPQFKKSLLKTTFVEKYKFDNFTNYKKFNFLRLTFEDYNGFKAYSRVFNKKVLCRPINNRPVKYRLFESNIEPMLRCMHIRQLKACGWIKIPKGTYSNLELKETCCDIELTTKWNNMQPIDDHSMAKFIVASYDIECTSGDGTFPQPERESDKVIQIATTLSRYGESECYYKHIITLGSCDKDYLQKQDPNIEVESYETEEEVLIAWTALIRRKNPDIITGYNIFGFDYTYLYKRSKKLGIRHKFCKLSRFNEDERRYKYYRYCGKDANGKPKADVYPYVSQKLASSALGKNFLKFVDMPGRVQIDMMKTIQRDYKLDGYRLDHVAANFIKESVSDITYEKVKDQYVSTITTKSTFGLHIGKFITINYNDGLSDNKYNDGHKYQVLSLEKTIIKVEGKIDKSEFYIKGYKMYWTQAKDDVSPREMFRMFAGSALDRARIAKYCLQDASLCNILLEKLQVLNNNIGMANVCNTPLSYLFLRGQGVKIFSLVAKKCRERDHLVPVLKKPKSNEEQAKKENQDIENFINSINKRKNADDDEDEVEEEDNGYEGATVFVPTAGVYYEPIVVFDYGSLYPSSMIERNMSHEMLVNNDEYRDLPGYKYHVVTHNVLGIKPGDEEKKNPEKIVVGTKTCTFAQKEDGSLGIIPEILKDLLDARTKTKELMKKETDPFKKAVLEGLQLAYKVTANSLYGQTGSPVSSIFCKDIAASTTATGKERLIGAKTFMQETGLPVIVNYIKNKSKKAYVKYMMNYLKDTPAHKLNKTEKIKENGVEKKINIYSNKEEFIEYVHREMSKLLDGYDIAPECIYGDTDSVFINLHITDSKTGKKQTDRDALQRSINIGIIAGELVLMILPYPQVLCYEKTLWPFIIITKKRYVGNLYEDNIDEFKQKSMGIVLKRRDNAPIVKIAVGGIVREILMNHSDKGAVAFIEKCLRDIFLKKYPKEKFIVTKTLGDDYKTPESIVQWVLAQRIMKRDGITIHVNDRIPYVYVEVDENKITLQGDRVEDPSYAEANGLRIDYLFYITNQIMKPAMQFLELIIEKPEALFQHYITIEENRRGGLKPLTYYTQKQSVTFDQAEDFLNDTSNDSEINSEEKAKKNKRKAKSINTPKKKKKEKEVDTKNEPAYNDEAGGFVVDDF